MIVPPLPRWFTSAAGLVILVPALAWTFVTTATAPLPPAAQAAPDQGTRPPDLVMPVNGQVRVRVKRGPSAATHQITVYVDHIANGSNWDVIQRLPVLRTTNQTYNTNIAVMIGDKMDLHLDVLGTGITVEYDRDRTRRANEPSARVISPVGRSCGSRGSAEGPLDIASIMQGAAELLSCSCWEDADDFDYNDFAMCIDYEPGSVVTSTPTPSPTVTPTWSPTSPASPTATATLTPTGAPTDVPTPPPTDTPALPTATPISTATTMPLPTLTATPTPRPLPVFLPILFDERCIAERHQVDVVLVFDLSTSMRQTTRSGRTKLSAAIEAGRLFVDQLQFMPDDTGAFDRVAIVGFNDAAWVANGLTTDRQQAGTALDALPGRVAQGTRIDLGLVVGQSALAGMPRQGSSGMTSSPVNRVLVLLTDGLPNRVPTPTGGGSAADTVLAAAAAVRNAGTRVIAVGLGDADSQLDDLLRGVAGSAGDFHRAPDGEDLAAIYGQLAQRILRCPR